MHALTKQWMRCLKRGSSHPHIVIGYRSHTWSKRMMAHTDFVLTFASSIKLPSMTFTLYRESMISWTNWDARHTSPLSILQDDVGKFQWTQETHIRQLSEHKEAYCNSNWCYWLVRYRQHISAYGEFIFADLISDGIVLVYLDDILIHTSTWPQHIQALQAVLQRIQQHNLKLHWKKCKWGSTQLTFFGYIISAEGL